MVKIPAKAYIASFDVDPQCGFTPICPKEIPVPHGAEIIEALNNHAHFAQYRLGSKDAHPPNAVWIASKKHPPMSPLAGHTNVDCYWPRHCEAGSKGFELIEGLPKPHQYDFFIWKGIEPDMHPYGACYHDLDETLSTGAIEYLKQKQVNTVIVGGLATECCVKQTVLQLLAAKFKVIVNLEACKSLTPEGAKEAIWVMKQQGAIIINSSDELQQTSRIKP